MKNFSKRSFLAKHPKYQNKLLALLLREIYIKLLQGIDVQTLYEQYSTYCSWQSFPIPKLTIEDVADHYHHHLKNAELSLKEHNLLPSVHQGDRDPQKAFGSVTTYLDNVRSAYNVGNILRTIEGLRLGDICFSKNTPQSSHPKVRKTSMGAFDSVPSFVADITACKRPWIVIETTPQAVEVAQFAFPQECTIILGNEEYGVSQSIMDRADAVTTINMFGKKNSINIASAFAIVAHRIINPE